MVRRTLLHDEIDGSMMEENTAEVPEWLKGVQQRLSKLKAGKNAAEAKLQRALRHVQDVDLLQEEIRLLKIKAGLPESFCFDRNGLLQVVESKNAQLRERCRTLDRDQQATQNLAHKLETDLSSQSQELGQTMKELRTRETEGKRLEGQFSSPSLNP